ncbi:MAG: hypothetical protein CL927_01525 [Deltaproteobacteria bacterium]|nr:hypothetical protein [Deltaproteobacteria bacterium]HCH65693.1 hypothetical protein [Deltaproteobacteria bacterium]
MPRRSRSILAALALAAAVAPAAAIATTYAKVLGVEGLIQHSDRVVRGEVVRTESRWTPRGYIETLVTIDVDDVYAGQAGNEVTVVAPGGTIEGQTMAIDGAPTFTVGEDVVVFANGKKIVGFGQGAFAVDDNQVARRSLGNELPHKHTALELDRAFGQPDVASACIDQHIDTTQREGWMLRGATGTRLGRDDVAMWRVNLLANMEYRLDACADGLYEGAQLVLTDEEGSTLSHASGDSETSLRFTPAETGVYYVGLYAEDLPEGVWRGAASISIHYR